MPKSALPSAGGDLAADRQTEIQQLFHEWDEARKFDYSHASEEECERKLAEYVRLKEAVISAEPLSPRDLALMLYVDTDAGDSEMGAAFRARLCRLVGVETWGMEDGEE